MRSTRILAAIAGASLSCLAAGAAQAQNGDEAETVACPVESLTAEITTDLPEGWSSSTSPVTARLEASEVEADGDALLLVCRYGAAGTIAMQMPERFEDCAPVAGGFSCTEPQNERFAARGRATLAARHGLDLDTGREQQDRRLNDVWFTATSGGQPVLEAFNNTTFSVVPRDQPGNLRSCQSGQYDVQRLVVGRSVGVGQSVCFQTEQGRFGLFRILEADQSVVDLRFRTLQ
jgi:hypothetical protein